VSRSGHGILATPTATQNTQARCARNAEGRRKPHHTSGEGSIPPGREKLGTTSSRSMAPEPRSFPFSKAWCTAGVSSGLFLRPSARRPRSGRLRPSASLLDLVMMPVCR